MKPANCTKRRCSQIKPQLKVEIEDNLFHFGIKAY